MGGYAEEINQFTQADPPWTFQAMATPAVACAQSASQGYGCRTITTYAPSDIEAHRDHGGHAGAEVFRIARMKERVWFEPFGLPGDFGGNATTLQPWAEAEVNELARQHDNLALASQTLGPELLTLLQRRWQDTLQMQQSLQNVGDCSWAHAVILRSDSEAAAAKSALVALSVAVLCVALSLSCLTYSSYTFWWWAHRREDASMQEASVGAPSKVAAAVDVTTARDEIEL